MEAPMSVPTFAPPRSFQFRLGTLLLAIVWVALVSMGLRTASELWSGILFVLAAGSMLLAALISIYRTGRTRAFALGFVIFGGWYTLLALGEQSYDDPSTARPDLLTTRGAIALYLLVHGDGVQTTAQSIVAPVAAPYTTTQFVAPAASYQVVSEVEMVVPAGSPLPTVPPPPTGPPPTLAPPQPVITSVPMRYVTRTIQSQTVSLSSFLSVAHNSLLMLLGLIGGITAQYLYATRRDEHSRQPAAN
jgi:hypothetical protein